MKDYSQGLYPNCSDINKLGEIILDGKKLIRGRQ